MEEAEDSVATKDPVSEQQALQAEQTFVVDDGKLVVVLRQENEELRHENRMLRIALAETSVEMTKLRSDFDMISAAIKEEVSSTNAKLLSSLPSGKRSSTNGKKGKK